MLPATRSTRRLPNPLPKPGNIGPMATQRSRRPGYLSETSPGRYSAAQTSMRIFHVWIIAALFSAAVIPVRAFAEGEDETIRQNLFSACFVGGEEAWMVGELGRIFHTADGGFTFRRSPTGGRDALLSVACLANGVVIATGPNGLAMRSTDKGKSWETLPTGTERNLISVAFATPDIGVAIGDYGTILRTENGGTNWAPVPLPLDIPLPEDIAEIIEPGDVLLYDVTFATAQLGWMVGEFGVILKTVDAGRSWQAVASPVETTLFGVGFADTQNGWAVGIEGVMLHSTDGGNSWQQQRIPGRRGFVLALYDVAVNDRVGWAVGDSGFLLRTVDAGASWQQVDLPIDFAANWFRGIAMNGATSGLIVGSEGLRLTTSGEEYRRTGNGS
jgi:photosystem II stability/assembly factor-like uncharacterized protein